MKHPDPVTPHRRSAARRAAAPWRVLVTGFEPFGGDTLNPSEQIARALDGQRWTLSSPSGAPSVQLIGRVLPCAFHEVRSQVPRLIEAVDPVLVMSLGLAGISGALRMERVALNLADARIADNAGAQPIDQPVLDGEAEEPPLAYAARCANKAIVQGLREAGIPAELSLSAGSFVCNAVFYLALHTAAVRARAGRPTRVGFCHLPFLPGMRPDDPSGVSRAMPLAQQLAGVRRAIEIALCQTEDLAVVGGSIA